MSWRHVVYILVLVALVLVIGAKWSELVSVWREHLGTFLALTIIMSLAIVVQARNFLGFLPSHCARPRLVALIRAWALGALANYLGPFQAGLAVRALLLRGMGIPVVESSIASVRQTVASLWMSLVVAGASLLWLDAQKYVIPAVILLAVFAALPLTLPMARRILAILRSKRGLSGLGRLETAVALAPWRATAAVAAQYCFGTLVFFVGYRRFGVDIDVAAAAVLACAVYVSSITAVLPGNLGVLEALCAGFGTINGLSPEESLALAFLFRAASVTGILVLAALPRVTTGDLS